MPRGNLCASAIDCAHRHREEIIAHRPSSRTRAARRDIKYISVRSGPSSLSYQYSSQRGSYATVYTNSHVIAACRFAFFTPLFLLPLGPPLPPKFFFFFFLSSLSSRGASVRFADWIVGSPSM